MSRPISAMVRWRLCLALAALLLLPTARLAKSEDSEDDEPNGEENEEEENNEEESDDDDQNEKTDTGELGRKMASAKPLQMTRTTKKRPLECYVCAYKAETPLRACLDPAKFKVHTTSCHNMEDSCFTSVLNKGATYDAVVRGCRSGCVTSADTTCCGVSRCNNQAFAMPVPAHPRVEQTSSTTKTIPSTVLYFVTVLLLLQTVVKVAFV